MKVLIADDEQLSRAVLGQLLTRAGYQVVVVERGDELDRALGQVKQLEAQLAAHTHASLTHGLCEKCLERHFPGGPDDKGP
ncbi:MAG: response regulator [Deltaproteobacteria bacterium]|nr:response regulator [Deltaproteobacteria bacterium]